MAEVLSRNAVEIAAGRKVGPVENMVESRAVMEWPAVHAFANGDTVASGLILKKGSRLCDLPLVSNGAGTAATTLSIGLRDPVTKVAVDATAIVAAVAINAAQLVNPATGTKLINGQRYLLPQDCEIYATLGGGVPLANQAIRVEVGYMQP